jgi:hypothetical protein
MCKREDKNMRKRVAITIVLAWIGVGGGAVSAAESSSQASGSPLTDILHALEGRWTLSVKFEAASGLPPGTEGSGEESWRAAVGGKALVTEEAWKAGPVDLSILGVLWWNYRENKLHAMDCNNQGKNICEPKDAAEAVAVQWDGHELSIEEPEKGRDGELVTSRVTFKDITADSFSEVNAVAKTPGKFVKVMTIHATRRKEL